MVATENLFFRSQANHRMEQTVTAGYSPDILKLPNPDASVLHESFPRGFCSGLQGRGGGQERGLTVFPSVLFSPLADEENEECHKE